MSPGRWIIAVAAAGALMAPASADAADLRLGAAMKFFGSRPSLIEPVGAVKPSLDFFLTAVRWNHVQRGCKMIRRGTYDWDRLDRTMIALALMRLRTYVVLSQGPRCSSLNRKFGLRPKPEYVGEWASFARRVVARYGGPRGPIKGMEVWNEPNRSSWPTGADSYGRAFVRVSKAVQRENRGTKMISGGLGSVNPAGYIRSMYRVPGVARQIDAIGAHLYSPNPRTFVKRLKAVQRAGPGRTPLVVTEHGWATCPRPDLDSTTAGKCVSMKRQATYMGRVVRQIQKAPAARVTNYFWFAAQDFAKAPRRRCPASPKDFFGFYLYDGRAKPSQDVWEQLTDTRLPDRIPANTRTRECRGSRDRWR